MWERALKQSNFEHCHGILIEAWTEKNERGGGEIEVQGGYLFNIYHLHPRITGLFAIQI